MTKKFSKRFSNVGKRIGDFGKKIGGFLKREGEYTPLLSGTGVLGWVIALILLPWIIFADWSVFQFAITNWQWLWFLPSGLVALGVIMLIAKHRARDSAGYIVAGGILFIAFYIPAIFDAAFWGIRWAFGVK